MQWGTQWSAQSLVLNDVGCISNEQMMGKKIWMDIKVNIKEKPDKQKRLHDREWLPKPKCWQTMILDYAEVDCPAWQCEFKRVEHREAA